MSATFIPQLHQMPIKLSRHPWLHLQICLNIPPCRYSTRFSFHSTEMPLFGRNPWYNARVIVPLSFTVSSHVLNHALLVRGSFVWEKPAHHVWDSDTAWRISFLAALDKGDSMYLSLPKRWTFSCLVKIHRWHSTLEELSWNPLDLSWSSKSDAAVLASSKMIQCVRYERCYPSWDTDQGYDYRLEWLRIKPTRALIVKGGSNPQGRIIDLSRSF